MNKKKIAYICFIICGVIMLLQWRTWLKIIGIVLIGAGAFLLLRKKKESDAEPERREGDTEIDGKLRTIRGKIRLMRLLFGITVVIFVITLVVSAFTGTFIPLLIVAVIGAVIKGIQENFESKLKEYVAENITRAALEEVFDIEEYAPFGHIPVHHINGSHFGIPDYDRITGSDYVRGKYKGLPIEISDVRLISESISTDEDGNEQRSESTVFQGLWLVCDFGKKLSADMRLWERGKLGKMFGGKGIKTENEQFNKHFYIASELEQEAFYILTPHMMEYILEMDKKAGGETHMRFERGGVVQIAIDSGRDAFEVKRNVKDAALIRQQFVREIRYITDLIDELRLADTVFEK